MDEKVKALRLGLLGWPLGHSLSPAIHSLFLERSGLDGEYREYPVRSGELAERVRELSEKGILGLNVTYPHKEAVTNVCNEMDEISEVLSAVNTLVLDNGRITGYNTDVMGFQRFLQTSSPGEPFLVIGGGGAARAVDVALLEMGLDHTVFCRKPGSWKGRCEAVPLEHIGARLAASSPVTVVNATTLGWKSDDDFPLSASSLRGNVFVDLNYNDDWIWRRNLSEEGVPVHDGLPMLVFQAAESFRIWTGLMPDADLILSEIRQTTGS